MPEINKDDLFASDLSAPLEHLEASLGDVIVQMEKVRNSGKRMEESLEKANQSVDEGVADNKKLADALMKIETLEKKLATAIKTKTQAQEKSNATTKDTLDGLDTLAPAQAGAVKGFMAMANAAKAFIATPIGAVVGALAIAIGSLIGFFRGSEAGQNKFNRAMAVGAEIMEKLTDYIETAGEAIFNGLGKAFEWLGNVAATYFPTATAAVKGFMNDMLAEADRISDLREKANQQERALIEERARVDKEASRLRNQAMELEGQAKLDLVNQAIALEKKLMDQEMAFAKTRLEIAQKDAADDPTIENKKAQAEATAQLYTVEKNYHDAIKKFNSERIKLEEEINTQVEGRHRLEQISKTNKQEYIALTVKEMEQTPAVVKGEVQKLDLVTKYLQSAEHKNALQAEINKQEEQQIYNLGALANSFGSLSASFKKGTIAQKLFATAQATINTYLAATQVLADPKLGPIAKVVSMVAIIAQGLKQVAAIKGVSGFFKGTDNAPEGLAFVGEKGMELIQTPSGKLALSPNRATLAYLEKGSKVFPHEETMAMLANAGVNIRPTTEQQMASALHVLGHSIKKNGEDIVQAITQNGGALVQQGSQVYKAMQTKDGNRKYIRLKSLSA